MAGERTASRLEAAFRRGRPALVAYLMAGYPDRTTSLRALARAADAGADVIELGVPYGDPLADGPVIADAAQVARRAPGGFGLAETIDLAREFISGRGDDCPPLVLMTYLNPLMSMGLPRAADLMREAGVAGVIVPDMPPEAARPWRAVAGGLDTVFLLAPTSTDERVRVVADASAGFVYCVSTTGVTGERETLADAGRRLVERVRAATTLPVAIGFGIGTPEQAAEAARIADGVIVGSAIVRRQHDPSVVGDFVRSLARAVHESGRGSAG
ncbi:tryptophan synthase subunit alpha [Coriobacteriia bacterium Es71-Z0120]|uniref:tryptophan synthase subunit alpha n=1 Tax=Parvivirga hydrogeniphila TaxID=2939460 RepID=UPI002260F5C5|nr:tryptophan synthase subunit alpha [Parvivirga hydrogeniphila]MCL4078830.1 tryptophan synthase subunit alpha [Parvivirga hydrogeniphila]